MYDVFKEQADRFFKPFSEIASIQVKTLETISQKQTEWLTGFWQDSVSYARHLPEQKNIEDVFKSNQAYLNEMGSRWRSAAEASAELLTESNQKIGALLQSSMKEFSPAKLAAGAQSAATTAAPRAKKVSAPASKSGSSASGGAAAKSGKSKASATKASGKGSSNSKSSSTASTAKSGTSKSQEKSSAGGQASASGSASSSEPSGSSGA